VLVRPRPLGRDTGGRPLLAFGLLLLPFAGTMKRLDRRRATRRCWTLLLMLGSATCLVGCGGGSSGSGSSTASQPQSYNITVTGTSGPLTSTTIVILTIQ
jgi:hypothetical protein